MVGARDLMGEGVEGVVSQAYSLKIKRHIN